MKHAVFAFILLASTAVAADEDPVENARLPRLWKVVSRTKVPADQAAAIGKKLGAEIVSLENDVIDAGGVRVQVNLAHCADQTARAALYDKFVELHGGDHAHAVRRGNEDVAEIVCANREYAWKAGDVVDGDRKSGHEMIYKVSMDVAPLERCDPMRWNRLFNLLAAPEDPKNAAAIETEAKAFAFSDRLRIHGRAERPQTYPAPTSSRFADDVAEFEFAPLPRVHGVPRVHVDLYAYTASFTTRPAPKDVSSWTAATPAWPTDAPEVRAALADALAGDPPKSAREKAERIVGWIHAHVRYGGDEVGSRYGVAKVLAQGYGHCWDQSDVFVALCRAAGVPARQVGGWLANTEGHVWAEVVVEDGRLAVDPGTTWLGVSNDYAPLWSSDDGRTPFVYWGAPKLDGPYTCIR